MALVALFLRSGCPALEVGGMCPPYQARYELQYERGVAGVSGNSPSVLENLFCFCFFYPRSEMMW